MIHSLFRFLPRRSHVEGRDAGAAAIVVMMMALVFVPIAAAHIAAAYQDSLSDLGTGQIASFIHMLMPTMASN